MKQSQLSFNTAKRGAAAAVVKPKIQAIAPVTPAPPAEASESSLSNPIHVDDSDSSLSDNEPETPNLKKRKSESSIAAKPTVQKKGRKSLEDATTTVRINPEPPKIDVSGLPELNIKDPRWRKLYADAKAKMGGQIPIHGKDENKITEILRVFDLNDEYGPCVGLPRLERWERAKSAGLNPPQEIFEILTTKQGKSDPKYAQTVFYGEVLE